MDRRSAVGLGVALLVAAGAAGYGLWYVGAVPTGGGAHDRATVTIHDEDGTRLATVDARVADTRAERVRGLSGTERLPNGSGMLFVHPREETHTYVMRGMEFPLDVVFVVACDADCPAGADGRIGTVHEAPVPSEESDERTRYRGRAKWVLEVPRGYTDANGIEVGDYVSIRYGNASGSGER